MSNSKIIYLFLAAKILLFVSIFLSCTNDPNFDDSPEIEFIGFSSDTLIQGDLNSDSLFITVSFKDGDGDLGGVKENIIITDNRTGDVYDFFKIPDLGNNSLRNGIEGTMELKIYTTCCIFPESIPPCFSPPAYPENDLSFTIVMRDNSGNESAAVTTPTIKLLCN